MTIRLTIIVILFIILILSRWAARHGSSNSKENIDSTVVYVLGLGFTFIGIGLLVAMFLLNPLWRYLQVSQWDKQTAQVELVRQGSYSDKFGKHWKGELVYSYTWNGQLYFSNRIDHDALGSSDWQELIEMAVVGDRLAVWINPAQPWHSALRNRIYEPWLILVIGAMGVSVSLAGLLVVWFGLHLSRNAG